MTNSTLTLKQALFAKEYLRDLNGTQAAIRAGYSAKTACEQATRLLSSPKVAAAIQAAMDKRSERTNITADYVLNTIVSTIERCSQARPVVDKRGERVMVATPDGELAPAFTFDATAVLKGAELLGKHLKLFTEVRESKSTVVHSIDERSADEARNMLADRIILALEKRRQAAAATQTKH